MASKTVYPMPDSRRVYVVLKPNAKTLPQELSQYFPANVLSLPVVVDYLFVDNNTFFTYEYCPFNQQGMGLVIWYLGESI